MTQTPEALTVGAGLKPGHVSEILEARRRLDFFEVHAENYMGAGGPPHRHLTAIRERYELSIHGVGLSLGGGEDLDSGQLDRLAALVERYQPMLVSEHLAWCSYGGAFFNDLLPLPYTRASLAQVNAHIDQLQNRLKRQILLENPSTYLAFAESELGEAQFIAEVAARSGCGLLLDLNNVFVSAVNHAFDASDYLADFPISAVKEIHLAGHSRRTDEKGGPFLIDSHDAPVSDEVWDLYRQTLAIAGRVPTLVERDARIPPWHELEEEALRARTVWDEMQNGHLALAC